METANDTICAEKACKEDGCGNCYVDRILLLFQEHAHCTYDLSPAMTYVLLEVVSYDKQKLIEKSHRI